MGNFTCCFGKTPPAPPRQLPATDQTRSGDPQTAITDQTRSGDPQTTTTDQTQGNRTAARPPNPTLSLSSGNVDPTRPVSTLALPVTAPKTPIPPVANPYPSSSTTSSSVAGGHRAFTFKELEEATNQFDDSLLVGKGGFGPVYLGMLETKEVAIKRRKPDSKQGQGQLRAELESLQRLNHQNIIRLIGFCFEEEEQLLVYEHMTLGSLARILHDEIHQKVLTWHERVKIAAGAARGLQHLHSLKNPRIIHRDISSSNILLDEEYVAKISDFGQAKADNVEPDAVVVMSGKAMGTDGYFAPEYGKSGILSSAADIYSYGVVLLEIFTGQVAIDQDRPPRQELLADWARNIYENGEDDSYLELADPKLQNQYHKEGLRQVLDIAVRCVDKEDSARPSAADVVKVLDSVEGKWHDPQPHSGQGSKGASTSSSSVPPFP